MLSLKCITCLSLLPSWPCRTVCGAPEGGVGITPLDWHWMQRALGESICQAPELFRCQLVTYLDGLQALMLPGCINFQSQVFALCFEVLSFRIPELFPKMSAPPQTDLSFR